MVYANENSADRWRFRVPDHIVNIVVNKFSKFPHRQNTICIVFFNFFCCKTTHLIKKHKYYFIALLLRGYYIIIYNYLISTKSRLSHLENIYVGKYICTLECTIVQQRHHYNIVYKMPGAIFLS